MEPPDHAAKCEGRRPSQSKPELMLQINFVPTDGTRLPIDDRSGDFGASPFSDSSQPSKALDRT
jgi:hypothetical protein